jgi:hypothetical protein
MADVEASVATKPSDDEYLAKPPGPCCLSGFIHEGDPRGSISQIAYIDTYVVHPKPNSSNNHILLYFPDVYGLFTNGLLVMDSFAEAGYTVLGLDYFRGVCCLFLLVFGSIL